MSSVLRVSGTFVGVYLFGNLLQIVANYFNVSPALVVLAAAGLAGFAAGYQYFLCNGGVLSQFVLHLYTIPMSLFFIVTALGQYMLHFYAEQGTLLGGRIEYIPVLILVMFFTCKAMRILFMHGLETAQKRRAVYG